MRGFRGFLVTSVTAASCALAFAHDSANVGATPVELGTGIAYPAPILKDYPGVQFFARHGQVVQMYGTTFGYGDTPEAAAADFVANNAQTFANGAFELSSEGALDGMHTLPIMYDKATGTYKFTQVYYTQRVAGIPVFRSELRVLVRNEPGNPIVLAESTLRNMDSFEVADMPLVDDDMAIRSGIAAMPDMANASEPEMTIFAGVEGAPTSPRLAVWYVADNGRKGFEDYKRVLYVADAATGEILFEENQILHGEVTGQVTGQATQGDGPDFCDVEASTALPYARVTIGATTAYADVDGNYAIDDGGAGSVSVTSMIRGQWFKVDNESGAEASLSSTVPGGGVANFTHNAANTSEQNRAEVNAYLHANIVRDWALSWNPAYPTIGTQTEWDVNVNIASTCNAFYDTVSINFYNAGGGCPNSAYSNVVYHEYGHHLVNRAGSGQGAYGEGISDAVGSVIQDRPETGLAFLSPDCNSSLRTAVNTLLYPCSGEIHFCGQLINGAIWETRNELVLTNPVAYYDIINNLTLNSILLHTGEAIDPAITNHFLTLDDDDGDVTNGTPHSAEILAGFGEKNMLPPTPPTCADVRGIKLTCGTGIMRIQVRMANSGKSGTTVTVSHNGNPIVLTVSGSRASGTIAVSSGLQTVDLVEPADCGITRSITCP